MEFFRQRAERFGQEGPLFNADRRFACMGDENSPFNADDIADIEELEQSIRFFTEYVFTEIELDFTAQVAEDAEGSLTVTTDSHEAAGDADEGIDAGVDEFLHLFAADLHLVIQFFFFNNGRFFFFRVRHDIPPRIYSASGGKMRYLISPAGALTVTIAGLAASMIWPRMAFPTGDSLEMRPLNGSASAVPTTV